MTSHVARLYALAASVLGLFLAWVGITAAPWHAEKPPPAATQSPTAAALAEYRQRLRRDARLVHRILEQRDRQQQQAASAPPVVRVVSAPPVATTKTS